MSDGTNPYRYRLYIVQYGPDGQVLHKEFVSGHRLLSEATRHLDDLKRVQSRSTHVPVLLDEPLPEYP
jgi:hypothetical protein